MRIFFGISEEEEEELGAVLRKFNGDKKLEDMIQFLLLRVRFVLSEHTNLELQGVMLDIYKALLPLCWNLVLWIFVYDEDFIWERAYEEVDERVDFVTIAE